MANCPSLKPIARLARTIVRILALIPHFWRHDKREYGSNAANPLPRTLALRNLIMALHGHFGRNQAIIKSETSIEPVAEDAQSVVIPCIFTHGPHHLLEHLHLPDWAFRQIPCGGEPMHLGFRAHEFLKHQVGRFDWYCFMEDDLVIEDALFFQKLIWWQQIVGPEHVLLPNRYELAMIEPKPNKLYVDARVGRAPQFWPDRQNSVFEGQVMGIKLRFERVINPHSGCFFISEAQLRMLIESPGFLDYDMSFVGPLESAASLAIMKRFRVYKVMEPHLHFFEIRHHATRFVNRLSITS
jgi:hypothetical protein